MNRTLLAVMGALLLFPAAAQADRVTIGSDLSLPATAARSDPNDIVWWPGSVPGATIDVPVEGQAIIMRVKGGTLQPRGGSSLPDYDMIRFVVLHPAGDGSWRTTSTSVPHRLPVLGRGADQNTVSEFTSEWPLCVKPGDRVALVSVGGFDPQLFPNGLPYQVFGARPGAVLSEFRAGGAIAEDQTVIRADRAADTELLMQVVIGTGASARPTCGGDAPSGSDPGTGPEPSEPAPPAKDGRVKIAKPARAPRVFDGKIRLTLRCISDTADCEGALTLRAKGRRIGRRAYHLEPGETDGLSVTLTRKGQRITKGKRRLKVVAVATSGGGKSKRTVRVMG
jgi:hypothetical protein